MIQDLGKRMEKMKEMVKPRRTKNQTDDQHTRGRRMNTWPARQNGRNHCDRTEYRFFFFNEDRLRGLWDNIKHTSICIIGVPEGEEREKGPKKIFE